MLRRRVPALPTAPRLQLAACLRWLAAQKRMRRSRTHTRARDLKTHTACRQGSWSPSAADGSRTMSRPLGASSRRPASLVIDERSLRGEDDGADLWIGRWGFCDAEPVAVDGRQGYVWFGLGSLRLQPARERHPPDRHTGDQPGHGEQRDRHDVAGEGEQSADRPHFGCRPSATPAITVSSWSSKGFTGIDSPRIAATDVGPATPPTTADGPHAVHSPDAPLRQIAGRALRAE